MTILRMESPQESEPMTRTPTPLSRLRALLASLAILACAAAASASLVAPMTVEEMAAIAEDIVHVRVAQSESVLHNGLIITVHDLEVIETLKGRTRGGDHMEVATPGGTIGALSAIAPGTPQLREGREAVLFLSRPADRLRARLGSEARLDEESPLVRSPRVVGGFQGAFHVIDAGTPEQRREEARMPASLRPMRPPTTAPIVMREGNPGRAITALEAPTLHDFKAAIRGLEGQAGMRTVRDIPLVGRVPMTMESPAAAPLRAFDPIPAFATSDVLGAEAAEREFDLQRREYMREQLRQATRPVDTDGQTAQADGQED